MGENSLGAVWEFKEYVAARNKDVIEKNLDQQGIRWNLNSPASCMPEQ